MDKCESNQASKQEDVRQQPSVRSINPNQETHETEVVGPSGDVRVFVGHCNVAGIPNVLNTCWLGVALSLAAHCDKLKPYLSDKPKYLQQVGIEGDFMRILRMICKGQSPDAGQVDHLANEIADLVPFLPRGAPAKLESLVRVLVSAINYAAKERGRRSPLTGLVWRKCSRCGKDSPPAPQEFDMAHEDLKNSFESVVMPKLCELTIKGQLCKGSTHVRQLEMPRVIFSFLNDFVKRHMLEITLGGAGIVSVYRLRAVGVAEFLHESGIHHVTTYVRDERQWHQHDDDKEVCQIQLNSNEIYCQLERNGKIFMYTLKKNQMAVEPMQCAEEI